MEKSKRLTIGKPEEYLAYNMNILKEMINRCDYLYAQKTPEDKTVKICKSIRDNAEIRNVLNEITKWPSMSTVNKTIEVCQNTISQYGFELNFILHVREAIFGVY